MTGPDTERNRQGKAQGKAQGKTPPETNDANVRPIRPAKPRAEQDPRRAKAEKMVDAPREGPLSEEEPERGMRRSFMSWQMLAWGLLLAVAVVLLIVTLWGG